MHLLNPHLASAAPPRRIVSLVPSQTELLYDLGLEAETAGITKFCVHPRSWFRTKTRIGGTKQLHIEKIRLLQPDLILANKEENVREQVEALLDIAPVWMSDIRTLEDALSMIRETGRITHRQEQSARLASTIAADFALLQPGTYRKALYLIWRQPWMTVGGDTFIHHMMQYAGLENVTGSCTRYPALEGEALSRLQPEIVLLSSEPYPFKEKHLEEMQAVFPHARVLLADGEMFSWYGSRLQHAPAYFRRLAKGWELPPAQK